MKVDIVLKWDTFVTVIILLSFAQGLFTKILAAVESFDQIFGSPDIRADDNHTSVQIQVRSVLVNSWSFNG